MNNMQQIADEYAQILTELPTRWDMLQTLIEIGKDLSKFDEKQKIPENLAPNCISQVYITVSIHNNLLQPNITADAHIVKGFAKIMQDMFTDVTITEFEEHAKTIIQDFITKTNIDSSFLSSRANAFGNMFEFLQQKVMKMNEHQP